MITGTHQTLNVLRLQVLGTDKLAGTLSTYNTFQCMHVPLKKEKKKKNYYKKTNRALQGLCCNKKSQLL